MSNRMEKQADLGGMRTIFSLHVWLGEYYSLNSQKFTAE